MRQFVLKSVLFALLFAAITAAVAAINKRYFFANRYSNEFPAKKELIRNTPSPKVVFLGGSNVAFGIDSKTLSDSLGLPVVNAGLHAGLGLRYIMQANAPLLRKGDILVIMPEYDHFFDTGAWGEAHEMGKVPLYATMDELLSFNQQQLSVTARNFCYENLRIFIQGLKKAIRPTGDIHVFQYLKSGFDERGDEVSHRFKPLKCQMTAHDIPSLSFNGLNEEYICEFIAEVNGLKRRGVRVIILPPAIADGALATADKSLTETLVQRFRNAGMPFQAPLTTFAYPIKYLYDTHYHLNAEGIKVNTRNVLDVLSKTLR